MKATVLIRPKEGILDPQGEAVGGRCASSGSPSCGARVGRLVDIELDTDDPARRGRSSTGWPASCSPIR